MSSSSLGVLHVITVEVLTSLHFLEGCRYRRRRGKRSTTASLLPRSHNEAMVFLLLFLGGPELSWFVSRHPNAGRSLALIVQHPKCSCVPYNTIIRLILKTSQKTLRMVMALCFFTFDYSLYGYVTNATYEFPLCCW